MGGVAGHLSHLQENLGFTFGDLKSILSRVASADIEAVEKVDGQNIFFTFNAETGQFRAARNTGDIKSGGMTPDQMTQKFTGHPAEGAFLQGFAAIEEGVGSLSADQVEEVFGNDGDVYVNAEIMYPPNPNIINYNGNYLVFHAAERYDREGRTVAGGAPGAFSALVAAIEAADLAADERSWKVFGPQLVELKDISEGTAYQDFLTALSSAAPGASDDMTLGDYVADRLRVGPVGDLPIPVHKQEQLIKRIVGLNSDVDEDKLPKLPDLKKGEPKDIQSRISKLATKTNSRKSVGSMMTPIEVAISDFAVEVLRGLGSFFVSEHDEETKRMQKEVQDAAKAIEASRDQKGDARREMLDKQMGKLGDLENIASTMEGIVFEEPPGSGQLYKLTGSFAMVNQIVGGARRIPSPESQQKESLLRNYIRLAILAG